MHPMNQMDHRDRPTDVRPGEELAADVIEAYLTEAIPDLKGPLHVQQYPCGASNLTYLLSFADRQLVLRRPPFGTKAATAHDMGREYKVLSALSSHWPYAPRPLIYCEDTSVIGARFYVMEHLQGIILRKEIPEGLFSTPEQIRQLYEKFVNALVELHSLDYASIGLGNLGKPEGYVRRQVLGWNKRFRAARTSDVPDCEAVMTWLEEKIPPETNHAGIIHNDFKLDNIVLDPSDPYRIIGVLDWEMCTIGDPLMDLGCTLGYWVQKDDPEERHIIRTMPTHVDGALTRHQFVDLYGRISGIRMDHFDFYHCFGLFRLAVIIQQIYYRFYHGQTQNPRAKTYAQGVHVLERASRKVMAQSGL
ncbi:MAG: phosphotransferase family protein [Deltaproteobacteria bacterium]|nr:phosphotransferase family protein [Deltaproteobacteria bacterium]